MSGGFDTKQIEPKQCKALKWRGHFIATEVFGCFEGHRVGGFFNFQVGTWESSAYVSTQARQRLLQQSAQIIYLTASSLHAF